MEGKSIHLENFLPVLTRETTIVVFCLLPVHVHVHQLPLIVFNCKNIFDRYLTHLCLASHKRDIGKQGAALNTGISIKHGNNKTGPNI